MKKIKKTREKSNNTELLSWFTLSQGLCPVLCKLAKISTEQITRSVYNPCSQQVRTPQLVYNQCRTHYTTTLTVRKQHYSLQHSPSTEPLSIYETSAEPTAPTQLQTQ